MKQNLIFVFTLIFLPICAFFAFWFYFLYSPALIEKDVTFYIKPGTGLHSLAIQLSTQGIIRYPNLFTLYARLKGNESRLKSGEYTFTKGATPMSIWSQITSGTGLAYHPFAIIPGWSFVQLRQALGQAEGLKHMIDKMSDRDLMVNLSGTASSPEGQFYPETYNYTRGESDLVILKRSYDLMQNRINDAWRSRASGLPYVSPYEILIAASLIEKEAYLGAERPVISGVVVNRLRSNMLLQMDPTVVYGMGSKYTGKIHRADLLADTPYNTYVHKGLPPTPIAFPSQGSINAAAHPQVNNYYYFVARGDGSHQFSAHLTQHNAAVANVIKQNSFTKDMQANDHLQDLLELNNDSGQVH